MKTNKLVLILVSIFLLNSCTKNSAQQYFPNNQELPSILSYFDISSKKTNAAFGVSFNTTMNDNDNVNGPVLFQGLFISNNGSVIKGGNVSLGQYNFISDNNGYYTNGTNGVSLDKNIMGKIQPINFQKPVSFDSPSSVVANSSSALGGNTVDSLYVPALLELISGQPTTQIITDRAMKVGHTFKWKPDPKNVNMGIIIAVEYYPDGLNNSFKIRQKDKIKHGRVIDDSGSFTLDNSFFVNIPVGAYVSVTLARANYKLSTDPKNVTYTLFAYNFKNADYIYKGF